MIIAYSSVLAWRIPGTGEPGGLPSMGSYRVRHNWSDLVAAEAAECDYCQKKDIIFKLQSLLEKEAQGQFPDIITLSLGALVTFFQGSCISKVVEEGYSFIQAQFYIPNLIFWELRNRKFYGSFTECCDQTWTHDFHRRLLSDTDICRGGNSSLCPSEVLQLGPHNLGKWQISRRKTAVY